MERSPGQRQAALPSPHSLQGETFSGLRPPLASRQNRSLGWEIPAETQDVCFSSLSRRERQRPIGSLGTARLGFKWSTSTGLEVAQDDTRTWGAVQEWAKCHNHWWMWSSGGEFSRHNRQWAIHLMAWWTTYTSKRRDLYIWVRGVTATARMAIPFPSKQVVCGGMPSGHWTLLSGDSLRMREFPYCVVTVLGRMMSRSGREGGSGEMNGRRMRNTGVYWRRIWDERGTISLWGCDQGCHGWRLSGPSSKLLCRSEAQDPEASCSDGGLGRLMVGSDFDCA